MTENRRSTVLKFIMPFQPCPGTNKGGGGGLGDGREGAALLSTNLAAVMVEMFY